MSSRIRLRKSTGRPSPQSPDEKQKTERSNGWTTAGLLRKTGKNAPSFLTNEQKVFGTYPDRDAALCQRCLEKGDKTMAKKDKIAKYTKKIRKYSKKLDELFGVNRSKMEIPDVVAISKEDLLEILKK